MMNDSATSRERLYDAIDRIVKASVTSGSRLKNMPELCEPLLQAVRQWYEDEGCCRSNVSRLSDEVGLLTETMANDFTSFVSGSGTCGDYPVLSGLMTIAHCNGVEQAIAYLGTAADNHAVKMARQGRLYMARARVVRALASCGDDADDADKAAEALEALAALGRDGEGFMGDLLTLTWALQLPEKMVADYLVRGQQVALLKGIREDLRGVLHRDVHGALRPLMDQARAYALPERFKLDRRLVQELMRWELECIPLYLILYRSVDGRKE